MIQAEDQPVPQPARDDLRRLLLAARLYNDERLLAPEADHVRWAVLGDPTEALLLVTAQKAGLDLEAESRRLPRLRELPFKSRCQPMSTILQGLTRTSESAERLVFGNGAPDDVLAVVPAMEHARLATLLGPADSPP